MDSKFIVLVLVFFLLNQFTISIAGFYDPVENIAIDCGSITGDQVAAQFVYDRLWLADDRINSENFTLIEASTTNKSIASTATQPLSGEPQVPYLTARVSHSEFTYSFPVSPGQKFIRLHFYPTRTYPGFESYHAFFSVSTGKFTLLNNFTGSPNIGTESEAIVFVREFLVNVGDDEKNLRVTFIPSLVIPNAYAFVNGVELVSMPTNLYYPGEPLDMVDNPGSSYSMGNDTALELMYRINVGGSQVPPEGDTGMYRNWDSDQAYAHNPFSVGAQAVDASKTIDLKFTNNAKNYTAPWEVYRTAQTMGPNKTNNELFNLTWRFPVDSGFTYLFRLHFCQLVARYAHTGDLIFSIYVAAFLAEEEFDLANWAGEGGVGVPLYRDYLVGFGNLEGAQETTKVNLSVQLHPAPVYSKYTDAILNGVEIFKASNSDGDIAGSHLHSNPNFPINTPMSVLNSVHTSTISKYAPIGVGSGLLVLCLMVVAFTIRFPKFKRKKMIEAATNSKQNFLPSSGACRCFSLSEIKAATNNFDQEFIIGHGGFGNVYKGLIDNGATSVAIKRLKQGSDQGANEFRMEIEMLSQLRYLHLVSFIGYCDRKEMILVYDYMSRGTLRDHLYNTVNPPLPWDRRLRICIGTARGLQYLHSGVKRMIIHRDIKTTNILLDEKWVAKVSDFGLSKVSTTGSSITHVSTMVKGSFGYLDPEYYYLQHLTQKSDVYSFGVVLCEVLCARPAIIRSEVDNPVSLAMWFRSSYQSGSLDEIIDPHLIGKIAPECLNKYAELAFNCIAETGVNRPPMGDVVWGLELALKLQDAAAKESVVEMEGRIGCSSQEEEESEAEEESTESVAEAKAEVQLTECS